MPLSFGIPLGIAVLIIGAILYFFTQRKKIALFVIGLGAFLSFLTLLLVILAATSQM